MKRIRRAWNRLWRRTRRRRLPNAGSCFVESRQRSGCSAPNGAAPSVFTCGASRRRRSASCSAGVNRKPAASSIAAFRSCASAWRRKGSNMKLDDEGPVALFNDPMARTPGGGCPEPDAFRRVALGEASAKERAEFVDHLVSCADCAEEYRVIPEIQSWAREAAARNDPGASRGRPGFPLWISAPAAAVLVAAG